MKIIIELSEKELKEMSFQNKNELANALYQQLDEAVGFSGEPFVYLVGYDIGVFIK